MENKKLNLNDEAFEGLADLLVAIGAECRRHGAKPFAGKRDPDDAACEYFVDRRADDGNK